MKSFEQFTIESIDVMNPVDLANLVKGLRPINRDTLVGNNPRDVIPKLRDFLNRNGYTSSRDGDTVRFKKPGALTISYYTTDSDLSLTVVMYKNKW